jgi:hypothetical protein
MADDPVTFGQELAEKAFERICNGMTGEQSAAMFQEEVANAARLMEAAGKSGPAIADWVVCVAAAYGVRIDELTGQ